MKAKIGDYIRQAIDNEHTISDERKVVLTEIAYFIQHKIYKKETINLNFICTHNSRRSHLAQIWAWAIAEYFDIKNLKSFSGGVEVTKVYPTVIKTFEEIGFEITADLEELNPIYTISFGDEKNVLKAFSKIYDDNFNPQSEFIAILVCSDADAKCPFIPNCEKRFNLPFEDPKIADNTAFEEEKYKERCLQIATEIAFIMKNLNSNA